MVKLLAGLWSGNMEPLENFGKKAPELRKQEREILLNHEALVKSLDKERKQLFDEFNASLHEYLFMISEQAFCDGFSMGTKVMAEAFGKNP